MQLLFSSCTQSRADTRGPGCRHWMGLSVLCLWACIHCCVIFEASVFSKSVVLEPVSTRWAKSSVIDTAGSFYCCYLFRASSPACHSAASPAAASPASARAATPAPWTAQVSEVDLQLRCYVVGWFAEMVIGGLVSGVLQRTDVGVNVHWTVAISITTDK